MSMLIAASCELVQWGRSCGTWTAAELGLWRLLYQVRGLSPATWLGKVEFSKPKFLVDLEFGVAAEERFELTAQKANVCWPAAAIKSFRVGNERFWHLVWICFIHFEEQKSDFYLESKRKFPSYHSKWSITKWLRRTFCAIKLTRYSCHAPPC